MNRIFEWLASAFRPNVADAASASAPKVSRPEALPETRPNPRKLARRPFRPHQSQSQRAANWEYRQSDAFKRAQAAREKQKRA